MKPRLRRSPWVIWPGRWDFAGGFGFVIGLPWSRYLRCTSRGALRLDCDFRGIGIPTCLSGLASIRPAPDEFMTTARPRRASPARDHIGWNVFLKNYSRAKVAMYHIYWVATFAACPDRGDGLWWPVPIRGGEFRLFWGDDRPGSPSFLSIGDMGVRLRSAQFDPQFFFLLSVSVAVHALASRMQTSGIIAFGFCRWRP